ncbi:MAG: hypothetical protein JRJ29_14820 [Deltaproteobacteria bacterium]|nr:hypothetical protein [Deltaproteobacteria bacterium]
MSKILCSLLVILLCSCTAGIKHNEDVRLSGYNFSIEFPENWKRLDSKRFLIFTRENPFLQYILVQQRPIGKSFRNTKRKITRGMLPEEAAEVVLDEITLDRSVIDLHLVKNEPATVNQYDAFKLIFTYSTRQGGNYRTIYYGMIRGDWFYSLRYNASRNHYSEADIEAFLKVLDSFTILNLDSS